MNLYPFKFAPRFVAKMWGGRALATVVDKDLPPDQNIGESWELYDFPTGTVGPDATQAGDDPAGWVSSIIANGPLKGERLHSVMLFERAALLGAAQPISTPHGPQFPLLVKFLDGRDDLSVQVHPPAEYAAAHPETAVKNECWYVLDHTPEARILLGAKPGTTREQFEASIRDGTCESLLNSVKVKKGDTFYLPSGTVHALGAGVVAAEVQTPSDTTFRVFDFNRVEPSTGKPRKLHVEQALECIDFSTDAMQYHVPPSDGNDRQDHDDDGTTIVTAQQFTLRRHAARAGERVNVPAEELRVYLILEGNGSVGSGKGLVEFGRGETILIPASVNGSIEAKTDLRWLEARLPQE
jgi:mannose-6-phosphate isomerase